MSSDKPVRKTRYSRKHLATDFDWEGLPDIELPAADDFLQDLREPQGATANPPSTWPTKQAARLFPLHLPGEDPSLDSKPRKNDTKPTKPKPELPEQRQQSPHTPNDRQSDLQRLSLAKETQELEIRKLELQLELAKITAASSQVKASTSDDREATKSMGDLKAPQRTRFPQPWPHIFAPGEPQLYSELSLPAFCAGYIAIMQQHKEHSPQNEAFLSHFHDLMVLACNYNWSAVRAYHYKVLRSIELGLVKWGDSFQPLKQPFFIPSALLSENTHKEQNTHKEVKQSTKPSSSIARSDICDAWSWYDDCSNSSCPKQHVCVVCKRADHRALSCPKRKFPVPTRRQDSTPRD